MPPNTTAKNRRSNAESQKLADGKPVKAARDPSPKGARAAGAPLPTTGFAPSGVEDGAGGSAASSATPQAIVRRPGVAGGKAVFAISQPVEDFFACGLLSVPSKADGTELLEVQPTETIASVVEQLHRRRLGSCIVAFANDKKEFFDCMDFSSYLLEVASPSASSSSGIVQAVQREDWEAMKQKIRRLAQAPVRDALKTHRGDASAFRRFDARDSFEKLLVLLRTQRRIPVYRYGELCRVITAGDALELCIRATEETKSLLEELRLADAIAKWPNMISKLQISEDDIMLEAIYAMREEGVRVVPVLEASGNKGDAGVNGTLSQDTTSSAQTLVGQFDICSLWTMFAQSHARGIPTDGSSGPFLWEDASSNFFIEPCMDFLALGCSSNTKTVRVPYAAVLSEEPLARAVSRSLSSSHQSVVVYKMVSGAVSSDSKPLEGIVSTLGLVIAMLEAGIFQLLLFDPGKPRREHFTKRKPTLTAEEVQAAIGHIPDNDRQSKVKFDSNIELDFLVVPTCPEHGAHFMRFVREDEPGSPTLDFKALKDWVPDAKAIGSSGMCLVCQQTMGRITQQSASASSQLGKPAVGARGGIFNLAVGLIPGQASPFGKAVAESPRSALKAVSKSPRSVLKGAPATLAAKQNRTTNLRNANERGTQSKAGQKPEESPGTGSSSSLGQSSWSFGTFGNCCTVCAGSKDTIAISAAISADAPGYRQYNSDESDGGGMVAVGSSDCPSPKASGKPGATPKAGKTSKMSKARADSNR